MELKVDFKIVAPCGIDCFNCEMYEKNVTDAFQTRLAGSLNVAKEEITCKGCIDGNQCLLLDLRGETCKTLSCVKEKGVNYCFECDNFPCENLMPIADKASIYPQNFKLYNLCMMKKLGVQGWLEIADDIRHTYYHQTMRIGMGGSK